MSRRALAVLTAALLALLTACGDDDADATGGGLSGLVDDEGGGGGAGDGGPTGGVEAGPDDPVLTISVSGGMERSGWFRDFPETAVLPDGVVVRIAPRSSGDLGPAIPELDTEWVDDDVLAAVEAAARDHGLDRGDLEYGSPMITDTASTVVEVRVDGRVYRHGAYALGYEDDSLSDEEAERRAALQAFLDEAEEILTADTGAAPPFAPERYRVMALPPSEVYLPSDADPGPTQEWPFADVPLVAEECTPIESVHADELEALLADATEATRISDDDREWVLVVRPVLAHEPTCPDVG